MSSAPDPRESLLLLVWIHGFKGGDHTFGDFPTRISTVLQQVHPLVTFVNVLAPAYDTRGVLVDSVIHHTAFLEEQVRTSTAAYRKQGGNGQVKVILAGHSMGGLVIADVATKTQAPILGLLSYDTPYYGLNPTVFKSTAEKYLNYANQGQAALAALGVGWGFVNSMRAKPAAAAGAAPSESSAKSKSKAATSTAVAPPMEQLPATTSSSWLPLAALGAAAVAGAAGAAYWQRDNITWITSHLSFVAELWKTDELESRMKAVEEMTKSEKQRTNFHCFYTLLPPTATSTAPRTFIVLPRTPIASLFSPNTNTLASDLIQAHVDMFETKSDGVYDLGKESVRVISDWIDAEVEHPTADPLD